MDTAGDMEVLVLKRGYWANIFDCLLVMLARLDYFWRFDELIEGGCAFITEHLRGFLHDTDSWEPEILHFRVKHGFL